MIYCILLNILNPLPCLMDCLRPKALAKMAQASQRLELPWLLNTLREKDAVQNFDVVGAFLAVASGETVDGEGAPLFRVYVKPWCAPDLGVVLALA